MPLDDLMTRRASFKPATFNAEAMTVEAVASTFSDVHRRDPRGSYTERLDPAGLDLSGLVGAPVLDSHRQGSGRDQIGEVAAYRFEGPNLVTTIRFTGEPDAAPIVTRIREGILKGVSIGYHVARWADSVDPITKARVRTAAAWAISEVSAVPIPADPGATFRSESMPEDLKETTAEPTAAENRAAIRTIARSAGMTPEQADDMVDRDLTITEARAEAFDAMQTRGRQTPRIRVVGSHDDPATITRRQTDALVIRMAGGTPADDVRPFMGLSALDMARDALTRSGVSVRGLSADDVLTRAMTNSDFPLLVSNAMGKVAAQAYQAASSPLKILFKQRVLPNFKESTSIRLGEMGRLEELTESGEFTHTSRAEDGESMSITTFGRAGNVTRKLIVNDELNLLGDMTAAFGEAGAATEADLLVNLLTSNPNLSDGNPVFGTARGNQAATGAALSVATVDAARKAMRGVKGLDGKTLVAVQPKYLLVGPEIETEAFLAGLYAATTSDVNPFSGKLTLLVEPRITDSSWFIFADPARLPCLQHGYLAGAEGVQIQRTESWDTLGMKYRAWLDFGAGWLDWRGAFLNPGA